MDLIKISAITALIGLIALFFLAFYLEPKPSQISEITESNFGEFVKLTGEVIKLKQGTITQFDLVDERDAIKIISFKRLNISNGDRVEVIGKVDDYKGLLEINAEKISRIN